MSLVEALASVSSIPNSLVQRKIAAVIGSIVADAASLHLEWVYDQVLGRQFHYRKVARINVVVILCALLNYKELSAQTLYSPISGVFEKYCCR